MNARTICTFVATLLVLSLLVSGAGCSSSTSATGATTAGLPTSSSGWGPWTTSDGSSMSTPIATTISEVSSPSTESTQVSLEDTSSTQAKPAPAQSAVQILANALGMLNWGVSWSYEPEGDVRGENSVVGGELLFAKISNVATDGSSITFDAIQRYVGLPVAQAEAGKDGLGTLESPVFTRNAFKHPQTLPLAPDAGIILDGTNVDPYPSLSALGADSGLYTASPRQFADFFHNDYDQFSYSVGFWLLVVEGHVTEIYDPYSE